MNISSFDVMQVPLKGSNLIEASAGTGKTFSIGILVLRLLLQHLNADPKVGDRLDNKPIFINQILMVTFTTAAVAELEGRIREYLYLANKYASGSIEERAYVDSEQPKIAEIVQKAIDNQRNEKIVQQAIKDNLLLLDESNIMTIHSFCQSTLNEFAIETNQLFGVQLFTDTEKLLEDELNRFWRKYITTLDAQILKSIDLFEKRRNIKEVVKLHLDGKQYSYYDEAVDYNKINLNERCNEISDIAEKEKSICIQSINDIIHSLDIQSFIENLKAVKKPSKEKYIHVLNDINAFVEVYKMDKTAIKTNFPEALKSLLDMYLVKFFNIEKYVGALFFRDVYCLAIQKITIEYAAYLSSNNYVTYDQLIVKLYDAVNAEHSTHIREKLNEKYKAVFVDEFQDTDKMQYDIFYKTFATKGILFLIGDPKQSIYGWRKADMQTYFTAREQVNHVYNMEINFRSSAIAIDAMNHFFLPHKDFDTFFFQDKQQRIDYTQVYAPLDSSKGNFKYANNPTTGMQLIELANQSEIISEVESLTLALLVDNNYTIKERKIIPSDIGIVVRTNDQAKKIKNALAEKKIPSVVVYEEKVLTSNEAIDVLYLLQAVLKPSISSINRFLISQLNGYNYKEVLMVDDSLVLSIFQELSEIWNKNGVYPMLIKFSSLFNLHKKWMNHVEGERLLTNFFHLTEILNEIERKKNYTPEELIGWLERSVEGLENVGDEYELRMESDETAVNIVTIHKSKGLQYNIVLAPFLDLNSAISNKREFVQFYDSDRKGYVNKEVFFLTDEEKLVYETEQERESRRLIYVAITRTAYQFYVFHGKRETSSSLSIFFECLKNEVVTTALSNENTANQYKTSETETFLNEPLSADNFKLLEEDWYKLSFTALSYHMDIAPKERLKTFVDDYDAFVFDQLKFGAASGNLLHSLLELIDFSSVKGRNEIITKVLQQYLPNDLDTTSHNIHTFLEHILNVSIEIGNDSFRLNEISNNKRLSELEFDFPLRDFKYSKLSSELKDFASVKTRFFENKIQLQGLMNGKIDLFFEYNGKYYILDWKSNYLGYRLQDYEGDSLEKAMEENNYHLQYLIYIVAAKKMLESRLGYFNYEKQFGGVIYLFLRGIRKNAKSGIFTQKPSYRIIKSLEQLMYDHA